VRRFAGWKVVPAFVLVAVVATPGGGLALIDWIATNCRENIVAVSKTR